MNQEQIQKELTQSQPEQPNITGIPTQMKLDFERRSGLSFDDVRVHYNSDQPAKLGALAYTQGTQVHIGPGQEKHLPHELGHVIQQKTRHIMPTKYQLGVSINQDRSLEREADRLVWSSSPVPFCNGELPQPSSSEPLVQTFSMEVDDEYKITSYDITRADVPGLNPPNDSSTNHLSTNHLSTNHLSTNHSTAFNVFIYTLNYGMIGKTPAEVGNFFQFLLNAMKEMPGRPRRPRRQDKSDTLSQFQEAIVNFQQSWVPPIFKDQKQYRQSVFSLSKLFLLTRNSLAYTYLPGREAAYASGEAGKMQEIYYLLPALEEANDATINIIMSKIVDDMVGLFDTLRAPRDPNISYEPFIKQHLASIQTAFQEPLALYSDFTRFRFDIAVNQAGDQLESILNSDLTETQKQKLRSQALTKVTSSITHQVNALSGKGPRQGKQGLSEYFAAKFIQENALDTPRKFNQFLDNEFEKNRAQRKKPYRVARLVFPGPPPQPPM